jgi:hypothetical protein
MIKEWQFKLEEIAILNENALHGLPMQVGNLVNVSEVLLNPLYDYKVRLSNGDYTKVRESELTKINVNDSILEFKIGESTTYKGEEVIVLKIDYLLRQIEIEYSDGAMQVVNAKYIQRVGV